MRIEAIAIGLIGMAACNRAAPEATRADPAAAPIASGVPATPTPLLPAARAQTGEAAPAPRRFGEPVALREAIPLGQIAKSPGSFKGATVVTTGTVNAVCQERGCWMEITDDAHANVRMHGHSFFVPKDARGKKARVQGTVVLVKDGKECDEMAATGAQLELDATGVELL